jgi:hypothetical protein
VLVEKSPPHYKVLIYGGIIQKIKITLLILGLTLIVALLLYEGGYNKFKKGGVFIPNATINVRVSPSGTHTGQDAHTNIQNPDATVKQLFERDHQWAVGCYSVDRWNDDNWQQFEYDFRELHDGKCEGDPSTSPLIEIYKTSTKDNIIYHYDAIKDAYLQVDK